jgi:predicted methyltransferase
MMQGLAARDEDLGGAVRQAQGFARAAPTRDKARVVPGPARIGSGSGNRNLPGHHAHRAHRQGQKCGTLPAVMGRRWNTARLKVWCALLGGVVPLGLACSQRPEPMDARSVAAPGSGVAEPEPPDELAPNDPVPNDPVPNDAAPSAVAAGVASAAPVAMEPTAAGASPRGEGSDYAGEQMVEFVEIGRGDRVADLGGVSGYSLTPVRRALGPTGIVYVRRSTPPPADPTTVPSANDLGKMVWMNTREDAPFIPDATRLNAVTVLFSYPVVSPGARKKFNAAVLRALVPGGLYIIAGHEPSPDSKPGTPREPSAVSDSVVRADVQAAGFEFVEAADFVSSAARADDVAPTRYVLKFRKPQ